MWLEIAGEATGYREIPFRPLALVGSSNHRAAPPWLQDPAGRRGGRRLRHPVAAGGGAIRSPGAAGDSRIARAAALPRLRDFADYRSVKAEEKAA